MSKRVIFKYALPIHQVDENGTVAIIMPKGATIISCREQYGTPTLWAVVTEGQIEHESRRFALVGTGIAENSIQPPVIPQFLGTCLLRNDSLVLHVFEVRP